LSLGIAKLWRAGSVERVTQTPRPVHLFAQQTMALVLQEGGIARTDLDSWLGSTFDALRPEDRTAVLAHMLSTEMLHEDCGILGLGRRAERTFGRRHFSELVVSFNSPMLLSVMYGPSELGAVHPLALTAPRDGGPLVILLAGRSWEVVDVDWPRRRISVVAAKSGGRARWLGGGRPANFAICRSAEAVIAGGSPGCTLSKRAAAKLDDVKTRLPFIDSTSVPVVSNEEGSVSVWTFAGGLVNSALGRATGRHLRDPRSPAPDHKGRRITPKIPSWGVENLLKQHGSSSGEYASKRRRGGSRSSCAALRADLLVPRSHSGG
jgi:ATP-dependent helicase Lhr and Lhr-like helicase